MSKRVEVTSKKAASAASKVLRNPDTSKAAKSSAGSALSQSKEPAKTTSRAVASVASKVLQSVGSSKGSKTAAGSALTQVVRKKK